MLAEQVWYIFQVFFLITIMLFYLICPFVITDETHGMNRGGDAPCHKLLKLTIISHVLFLETANVLKQSNEKHIDVVIFFCSIVSYESNRLI